MRVCQWVVVMTLVAVWAPAALWAAPVAESGTMPVSILAPPDGATISGSAVSISVAFTANSSTPVSKIKVFLNGRPITERVFETPLASGSCWFKWDTTRSTNGKHQIDVQAFSGSTNLGTSSCSVTVRNSSLDLSPPKVKISSPKDGQAVSGIVPITVSAVDDSGDPLVTIYVDKSLRSVGNLRPYSFNWDTTKVENGPHVIDATGADHADNAVRAATVRVIVKNPVFGVPITAKPPTASHKTSVAPRPETGSKQSPAQAVAPMKNRKPDSETSRASAPAASETFSVGQLSPSTKPMVTKPAEKLPALEVPAAKAEVKSPGVNSQAAVASVPQPAGRPEVAKTVSEKNSQPVGALSDKSTPGRPAATVRAVEPSSRPVLMARAINIQPAVPSLSQRSASAKEASKSTIATQNVKTRPVLLAQAAKPADIRVAAKAQQTIEPRETVYVVKAGDCVSKLAGRFGVSESVLVAANNLPDANMLQIGRELRVPVKDEMVQLRPAVESKGGTVQWDGKARTVRANCTEKVITVKIGSSHAVVDGEKIKMASPAVILDGRTAVSGSFVNSTIK